MVNGNGDVNIFHFQLFPHRLTLISISILIDGTDAFHMHDSRTSSFDRNGCVTRVIFRARLPQIPIQHCAIYRLLCMPCDNLFLAIPHR